MTYIDTKTTELLTLGYNDEPD